MMSFTHSSSLSNNPKILTNYFICTAILAIKNSERTKKASVDTVCTNREQFLEDVLHWIVDRVQVGVQRQFIENRKCKCPVKRRFWPSFETQPKSSEIKKMK